MKFSKTLASVLVSLGLAATMHTATAAPIACNAGPNPIDTVAEWAALADGCFNGDKLYDWVGGTLAGTTPVGFSNFLLSFQIIFGSNAIPIQTGIGSSTLTYTITVFGTTNHITSVDLDSTRGGSLAGDTEVVKDVSGGGGPLTTLTSTNGSNPGAFTVDETSLTISETFSVTGNNGTLLNTAQNSFEQTVQQVPEPATLALLGLGLVGLGLSRRRKG